MYKISLIVDSKKSKIVLIWREKLVTPHDIAQMVQQI